MQLGLHSTPLLILISTNNIEFIKLSSSYRLGKHISDIFSRLNVFQINKFTFYFRSDVMLCTLHQYACCADGGLDF